MWRTGAKVLTSNAFRPGRPLNWGPCPSVAAVAPAEQSRERRGIGQARARDGRTTLRNREGAAIPRVAPSDDSLDPPKNGCGGEP